MQIKTTILKKTNRQCRNLHNAMRSDEKKRIQLKVTILFQELKSKGIYHLIILISLVIEDIAKCSFLLSRDLRHVISCITETAVLGISHGPAVIK